MNSESKKQFHFAELLSPAGNADGFYGAVAAGADAVYLAGNRFGARAYADNFTTEKLVECIRYAHLLGRKIYMTVNTLLKETEMAELYEYLLPFYEAGLDAVIVQDLGVLRFIRAHFPGMEIHVSTQMTICDGYGAKLLKEMGATRVVPARELSLQEIVSMKDAADIEIETFIHGAMCYCYSGQCLFSSILGGRSGNRGRCAQPCRLPYTVKAGKMRVEECYPLSLKDMCTIEHIPALIEAGIDSFKIEGRMKKPEYTAGVTDIYRRCMDRYYDFRERFGVEEAAQRYRVQKQDMTTLRSLYIRSDIQDGYYYKHNGKEMVTFESPAYSGSDDALLLKIQERFLTEHAKLPVTIYARFETGKKAWLTMSCCGDIMSQVTDVHDNALLASVTVEGDEVQIAQKQPITEENVWKQLGKLGDSAFKITEMNVSVSPDAFYPLKQMNELRRQAVERLEQEILKGRQRTVRVSNQEVAPFDSAQICIDNTGSNGFSVSVRTLEQLDAFVEWIMSQRKIGNGCEGTIHRLYVDGDLLEDSWETVEKSVGVLPENCEVWITLPYIIRHSDKKYLNELYQKVFVNKIIRGFLVRSMDGFGFMQENKIPCRADAGVYVWNESALAEVSRFAEGFCLPYELKASEQRALVGKAPFEKIVYGRIPMMITANCVLKTTGGCNPSDSQTVVLTDRYHKDFPVLRNCKHCYNIIYNSVLLSLHQECDKWRDRVDLRLDFTLENKTEVNRVLNSFVNGMPFAVDEYTTGHEKRGVE